MGVQKKNLLANNVRPNVITKPSPIDNITKPILTGTGVGLAHSNDPPWESRI